MLDYTLEMSIPRLSAANIIKELTRFVIMECDGDINLLHISGMFNKHLIFKIKILEKYQKDFEYAYKQLSDYIYGTDYSSKYKSCKFHYFVWFNRKDTVVKHWKIQLHKLGAISKVSCINFGLFAIIKCNIYKIDKENYGLLKLARDMYEMNPDILWH
jgi:hypothetical protein